MSELEKQIAQLEAAIANLEAQRAVLGDSVVDSALRPLGEQLEQLRQSTASAPAPYLKGERKLVTVMFADIAGFTALAERLDPETVRDVTNACFERLVPIVEKYEGTVDKFIGDAIMCLFGAPVAHEDDAERALRAALDMAEEQASFNVTHNTNLGLHFGVNTGLVIAGGIGAQGRQQYSVMGDTVNLAARLEDASEQGEVLVGPDTYRLTTHLFEFEALKPIRLKGKAERVPVYRLRGLKAVSGPTRGVEGLRSPLVGRDAELEQLRSALQALQKGAGSIVAIVGEAGLGKSRLVAEARKVSANGVTWAEGRGLSYTEGMSYWVARDLLRSLIGVADDAPLEEVSAILLRSVEALFPEQSAEAYPYLAQLLEVPLEEAMAERVRYLEPKALQAEMLRAFRAYVRSCALQQSLVLVWEDLHWADPPSRRLLETLLPVAGEAPLLLVMVLRTMQADWVREFQQQVAEAYGDHYRAIELTPLNRDNSVKLIDNLLKVESLPQQTRRVVLDKAEGNPFFLEELLRSLLDAGVVVVEGGRAVATRDVRDIDMPDTLQGVIAARIDHLPPQDKRTLQAASVIGRVFQRPVLAYLLGSEKTDHSLDSALHELERRGLIQQREGEVSVAGREYSFKHAVTHEVAYNSLLMAQRRQLHQVTAEAIETQFPDRLDELAATLAYHFQKAEIPDRALHYLTRAARHAQATYAYEEAIQHLRTALSLLDPQESLQAHLSVLEELADSHSVLARRTEAVSIYQQALDLWQRSGGTDKMTAVRLHRKIAETVTGMLWRTDYDRFEATLEASLRAGLNLMEGSPPHLETARLLIASSRKSAPREEITPDLDKAQSDANAAAQIAEQLDLPIELSSALQALAWTYLSRGLLRERVELAQRRLTIGRNPRFGDMRERASILLEVGHALLSVGEYAQAMSHLAEGEDLASKIGALDLHVAILESQAHCLFRLDRWDEVLRVQETWRDLERRYPDFHERAWRTCFLIALHASIEALRGNSERANALRDEAHSIMLTGTGSEEKWGRAQHY